MFDNLEKEREKVKNQIQELREKAKNIGQEFLNKSCQEIFNKYPELKNFSWTQYTDYFNDGDTCYFNTHYEYGLEINGEDADFYDHTKDVRNVKEEIEACKKNMGKYTNNEVMQNQFEVELNNLNSKLEEFIKEENILKNAKEDITKVLSVLDDEDYESMFGDHVKVVVSRQGISTEDYSNHD